MPRARAGFPRLARPAGILLALAVAGCSATGSSGAGGVSATGRTLTLYAAAPTGAADPQGQADVLGAEQLAYSQSAAPVAGFHLQLRTLTDPKVSNNARTAIEDPSAIAYLGEIAPGASAGSIGITNALDLLQVSPTDTAAELTHAATTVPGSPNRFYENLGAYGRTFARVVPTTTQEAGALVSAMSGLGVRRVYVAGDGSEYGRVLAGAFTAAAAGKLTIAPSVSAADGILLAMSDPARAPAAAGANPRARPFAPEGLFTPNLAGSLPSLLVVTPGFVRPPTPAAGAFTAAFRARYGHVPDPRAIFGYEAMKAVLDTLAKAGTGVNNRATVVHDFLAIKNRASVLGTYSIDAGGDSSLAPFVLARVLGKVLTPFRALPG